MFIFFLEVSGNFTGEWKSCCPFADSPDSSEFLLLDLDCCPFIKGGESTELYEPLRLITDLFTDD